RPLISGTASSADRYSLNCSVVTVTRSSSDGKRCSYCIGPRHRKGDIGRTYVGIVSAYADDMITLLNTGYRVPHYERRETSSVERPLQHITLLARDIDHNGSCGSIST